MIWWEFLFYFILPSFRSFMTPICHCIYNQVCSNRFCWCFYAWGLPHVVDLKQNVFKLKFNVIKTVIIFASWFFSQCTFWDIIGGYTINLTSHNYNIPRSISNKRRIWFVRKKIRFVSRIWHISIAFTEYISWMQMIKILAISMYMNIEITGTDINSQ